MKGLPVALDAMGGDDAPREVVRGGVEFAKATGRKVLLVGQEDAIRAVLNSYTSAQGAPVEIVPATQIISFKEKIQAIRKKKDSSIHVGVRLVRDGEACAFVSAGHTGAMMAMSKVILGLIDGVDRPVLPAPLPRRDGGTTILLDAGANLDCRPEHLRQFAVMGFLYARRMFEIANPRVALLSIGGEDTKGNDILRQVQSILRETRINFIGNVEGTDLYTDVADVVVCDGFVGNIALKVSEGVAESIVGMLKDEIRRGTLRRLGALALKPVFKVLKKRLDYAEYGGVQLLGLRKVAVVAHGRSNAKAIANALHVADRAVSSQIIERITEEIRSLHEAESRVVVSPPASEEAAPA